MNDHERIRLAHVTHLGEWVCFVGDAIVWHGGSWDAMVAFRNVHEGDPRNKDRPLHIVHPAGGKPPASPRPDAPRPGGGPSTDPPPRPPAAAAAITMPMECACVSPDVCVHRRASRVQ